MTVSVSRGPSTSRRAGRHGTGRRDRTDDARGGRVPLRIVYEDTDDFAQDGIVISQDPVGGSQAKPNTIVTLFVGRFVETTETTTTP